MQRLESGLDSIIELRIVVTAAVPLLVVFSRITFSISIAVATILLRGIIGRLM